MTQTYICVASGPSLTANDCAQASGSGYPVIAVNSSWRAVPDCRHIFAADFTWWDHYHDSLETSAELWTQSKRAHARFGVKLFTPSDNGPFQAPGSVPFNSPHTSAQRG